MLAGLDRRSARSSCTARWSRSTRAYRAAGVALPPTPLRRPRSATRPSCKRALVLAPPSVQGSAWMRRFGDAQRRVRQRLDAAARRAPPARRRPRLRAVSDHADWPGCSAPSRATGAERVIVTHGYEAVMVRWLSEQGLQARRVRHRVRRRRRSRRAAGTAAGEPRHEALRRACSPSSTRARRPARKVDALQRYFAAAPPRRRGLGGVLPGRRQAAPGGADRRAARRCACEARRHRRLAVRRVLPGGRRPGRDHRARAAAAGARDATSAWPSGSSSACCRCAACRPSEQARSASPRTGDELDAPGRFLLIKLIGGGFRVGVSKLLVQRALAEARRRRRQAVAQRMMGYTDGARRARRRALPAAGRAGGRRARPLDGGQPYPFFLAHRSTLPPDAFDDQLGPPTDWLVEWKYDGIRAQVVQARRPGLALVARRGAGDRALPRDRRRWRRRCPTAPCSTARSLVWQRRARGRRRSRCCSSASAARR